MAPGTAIHYLQEQEGYTWKSNPEGGLGCCLEVLNRQFFSSILKEFQSMVFSARCKVEGAIPWMKIGLIMVFSVCIQISLFNREWHDLGS
jgi:hypothetical protein